jgi:parvulin-like peptidyl-prolyl isomerase
MPQNKKFLAQKEIEDRQKKIVIISTIAVLVIVIGLVVYGVVDRYVFRARTTVIELESYTINADEFEQQVRWSRRNLILEIDQILNTFQQLGGSPEVFAYFEQQLILSTTQLEQPLLIGQEVLQSMTDDIILLVEAEKMGIKVDEVLIDREIEEAFGFYADGTPTPLPTQELSGDGSDDQADQPTVTPRSESDDQEPDPTATPLLIPTEYTEDLFKDVYQDFLNSIKDDGINEKTIRYLVKMSVIREEVLDAVTANVERTQEQIWVRHILVDDEETALDIAGKLAEGEDFADLAAEYSTDESNKDSGGDLGWFAKGRMVPAFEEAAFGLNVGEISDPVQTDFGWHILESLGKDDLLLDPASYDQLKNEVFTDWLNEKRIEYQPKVNQDWVKYVPTEPTLPAEYITYIQSLTAQKPQLPPEVPEE